MGITNKDVLKTVAIDVPNMKSQLDNIIQESRLDENNLNKPIVTFIDDDCTVEVINKWKPICDSKGIKISLGVITGNVGTNNYMSLEQLKTLKNEGFDILSHSKTHPHLNNITDVDWEIQCRDSYNFVKENGFNTRAIVYPFGVWEPNNDIRTSQLKAIARRYYQYGIDSREAINPLPVDNMQVQRVNFDGTTLSEAKTVIDKVASRQQWLVILTHSGYATNMSIYPELIDYIKSKNCDILTFEQAQKRVGNTVGVGDTKGSDYFFLSKDGKLNSSSVLNMQYVVVNNSFTNIDEPLTSYPVNKVIYSEITASADTMLSKGGHLMTYRSSVTNQSYQQLVVSEKYANYRIGRRWLDSSSAWGEWQWLGGTIIGARPTIAVKGMEVYDGTIQKKIMWLGSKWVDMNGTTV